MPIVTVSQIPPGSPSYPSDSALFFGVESEFQYNGLTLNDRSLENKYRITQIGGIGGADVRDNREVRQGRDGERSLSSFYAGRTITLGGRIEALNDHLHGLRVMTTNLNGAFNKLRESTLYINQGSLGGWDTQIDCRPSQPIAMSEEIKTWYHYRDFLVTLRAADPRILSQQETTQTWVAGSTSYTGEPILVHENRGNYNADLRITLKGPMTNPTLIIGDVFFSFLGGTTITAGQEWTIDTKLGTVTDVGDVNKYGSVSLSSTLPYYVPGSNTVIFGGSALTVGTSSVTVSYRHSWI
jgi:hypothetical protein